MWQITVYKVLLSHAKHLERLVNPQVRKWLELPRCLSSFRLYISGALSLSISSLVEEYKCAKVRLNLSLTESQDLVVRGVAPTLATGNKWTPTTAVLDVKFAKRQKATTTDCRTMVVEEVCQLKEAARCSKAIAQAQQDQWMRQEGVERWSEITWSENWSMASNRPQISISGLEKIHFAPCVQHWQPSSTFQLAARLTIPLACQ